MTSPSGGVIFPIVFRLLQPTIGFGWATRVIAFISLGLLIFPVAIMRMRKAPGGSRALLDLPAFSDPGFTLFALGLFLVHVGVEFPFYYAPLYGSSVMGLKDEVTFYIPAVMNAGSLFGRVIPGLVADKVGSLNTIIPAGFICAVLVFAWLGIDSASGLWVFSGLYGACSGALLSMPATVVAAISPDASLVGTRMGMSFTFAGLGLLIGNPIAGAILSVPQGTFKGAQSFSAAMLLAGSIVFVGVKMVVGKSEKRPKA